LLLLEKFDFVWTMGPGLRRDDDQGEYVNFDSFTGSQNEDFLHGIKGSPHAEERIRARLEARIDTG
jgi:hypothetical protein